MDQKRLVFILASWCPHCTNLKKTKVIEKLSKSIPVLVLEDDKQGDDLMRQVKSPGYPTILLLKKNKALLYKGSKRDYNSLLDFYKKNDTF